MTVSLATLPKEAKALPPEAQQAFVQAYNADFFIMRQAACTP